MFIKKKGQHGRRLPETGPYHPSLYRASRAVDLLSDQQDPEAWAREDASEAQIGKLRRIGYMVTESEPRAALRPGCERVILTRLSAHELIEKHAGKNGFGETLDMAKGMRYELAAKRLQVNDEVDRFSAGKLKMITAKQIAFIRKLRNEAGEPDLTADRFEHLTRKAASKMIGDLLGKKNS